MHMHMTHYSADFALKPANIAELRKIDDFEEIAEQDLRSDRVSD